MGGYWWNEGRGGGGVAGAGVVVRGVGRRRKVMGTGDRLMKEE